MSFNNISAVEHASNQEKVHRVNVEKGWFDKPVSFLEAMALLVTEIVEVDDAHYADGLRGGWAAPAQMASEFADIYIRLVDDCSRFAVDLGTVVDLYRHAYEIRKWHTFEGCCMQLLRRVRDVIEAYRSHGLDETGVVAHNEIAKNLACTFLQLQDACDHYGVDLMKAVAAKIKVNETRTYRHGGKHA